MDKRFIGWVVVNKP